MNNFAEFLYSLRKEKNITQAELANKLGVTNKAVSKWETGEAMPETSLLVPLSKIFGVSVDELLNGKRNQDESTKTELETNINDEPIKTQTNQTEDKTFNNSMNNNSSSNDKKTFVRSEHLFTRGDDEGPKTLLDIICGLVCACVFLLGLGTYMFIGAFKGLWHPYWVIMPVCALSCGIISLIFSLFDTEKKKFKLERGENPYTGAICGLVMLTCIITYLLLGSILNLWHPYWFIMVIGAVICGILGPIGNILIYKSKNSNEQK